jgi:hypothetical protein
MTIPGFSLFPILMIAILLLAVIIALYRKDRVKAAIWTRSSGFFLEANNDSSPNAEKKPGTDGSDPKLLDLNPP